MCLWYGISCFQDESSIESDEFDLSDSTRMSAVNSDLSSNLEERIQSPQNLQGQQDGKFNVHEMKLSFIGFIGSFLLFTIYVA